MVVGGTTYDKGYHGVAVRDRNPFNTKRRILCLVGIGPFGTAAASDFVINKFDEQSSKKNS